MLISKFKNAKTGKTNVAIVVHKNFLTATKNKDFFRIVLSEDFMVGLDEKHQDTVKNIINLDKLVDNTK